MATTDNLGNHPSKHPVTPLSDPFLKVLDYYAKSVHSMVTGAPDYFIPDFFKIYKRGLVSLSTNSQFEPIHRGLLGRVIVFNEALEVSIEPNIAFELFVADSLNVLEQIDPADPSDQTTLTQLRGYLQAGANINTASLEKFTAETMPLGPSK